MYTVNNLMRNVLITAEEVIFHAPTAHTLDPRQVEQSIIVAEERFIRPELGYELYEDLILSKNKTLTTQEEVDDTKPLLRSPDVIKIGSVINAFEYMPAHYQTLWKQHLWKIVAEAVMISAYPEGFIQFSSEGAFHKVPPAGLMVTSGFVTPLLSSMKWAIDKKVQDRVSPLLNSMHEYLCKNKTSFGYYKRACPDCDEEGLPKRKWSGIATDLYDDLDNERELHGY